MHHFYMILLLLFLLPCLNVLSLLLLDVFWPFLWHRLPFWNYLRLVCYMILKPHYQKSTHNLGQKVEDKLMKLSKKGSSMECFTADFLQFFTKKYQNLFFGWTAGYIKSKHFRDFLEIS